MSELNLTREYRPKTLKDYVSTKYVKDQVNNLLRRPNKPHFIIISGGTGLGKTTLARLICKEYRCEKPHGKTCMEQGLELKEECKSCKAYDYYIETGKADEIQNLIEMDVGKYSKLSDLRDLIDELNQGGIGNFTTFKELILDEVQSLYPRTQDALLKQLEEPEEDMLIIMSTTAVDKIQPTLISRAEEVIRLQTPSISDLRQRLVNICELDKIKYTQKGISLIATREVEKIRDSVQTLDNVHQQFGEVTETNVAKYLTHGGVSTEQLFDFIKGVIDSEHKLQALKVLYEVRNLSDFDTFTDSLISFVRRGIYIANGMETEIVLKSELNTYKKLFKKIDDMRGTAYLLSVLETIKRGNIEVNLLSLVYSNLQPIQNIQSNSKKVETDKKETGQMKNYHAKMKSERSTYKKGKIEEGISEMSKDVKPDEIAKKLMKGNYKDNN